MLCNTLELYNVKLYQLTPNSMMQLSKFFWGVKTFGGNVDLDTFVTFNELHFKKRLVYLEEGGPEYSGQYGVATFTPRRHSANNKRIEFSYAQRILQILVLCSGSFSSRESSSR